jgi:hypothetical protein
MHNQYMETDALWLNMERGLASPNLQRELASPNLQRQLASLNLEMQLTRPPWQIRTSR